MPSPHRHNTDDQFAGTIAGSARGPALDGADHRRVVEFQVPLAVAPTLGGLRMSSSDPTSERRGDTFIKAMRTGQGAATVAVRQTGPDRVTYWAWGEGAGEALDRADRWLGLDDPLESFDPSPHPVVAHLARRQGPVRLGRFGSVVERLVPTVLGQLVIAKEAKRSYRRLVARYGEPAPGPFPLSLSPAPEVLAALGSQDYHAVGVERKRAAIVQRVAREAGRLAALDDAPLDVAYRRLRAIPGIGPWTLASVGRVAFGDADAVVIGDYNLPHLVAWALAGRRRSNDEEMLELLAPFPGHRGRVQAMLKTGGAALKPPRRGPRRPFRSIERH